MSDVVKAPDPLEGKPRGYCPWCKNPVNRVFGLGSYHVGYALSKCGWDEDLTEDENRIRYAAQRLEESKMWNKINREGGEER